MDGKFLYTLLVNGAPMFLAIYFGNQFLDAVEPAMLRSFLVYFFLSMVTLSLLFGFLSAKTERDIEKKKYTIDIEPDPFRNN